MIKIRKVVKRYGNIIALRSVSLDIADGEFIGILGPNGAGKTTLINILSTLLSYDSGKVLLDGMSVREDKNKIKRIIGVIPQEISLYSDLSAKENLMFWGELYGIEKSDLRSRVNELLAMVGLLKRSKEPVKHFSGGMKRRLNIAIGLIHNPKILLLDEPTVGVDPQSRNLIFKILLTLHNVGRTIIYTTHYMEEAEKLCEKIAILDEGKIIKYGTLDELLEDFRFSEIRIKFKEEIPQEVMDELSKYFAVNAINNNLLSIKGEDMHQNLQKIYGYVQHYGIDDIKYITPNLEQLFLYLTGKRLRD